MIVNTVECLNINILALKKHISRTEKVNIILQYENNSPNPVLIRPHYFPKETLYGPIFKITRDGFPMNYLGRLAKRVPDTFANSIRIDPGKSLNTSIDISTDYELTQNSSYRIQFDPDPEEVLFNITPITDSVKENSTTNSTKSDLIVFIEERKEIQDQDTVELANLTSSRSLSAFRYCSTIRQAMGKQAFAAATMYADNAVNYLTRTPQGNRPRYATWFGRYMGSRWQTATSNFQKISRSLKNNAYVIDCSCTDPNVYAYVYPIRSFMIYICSPFWSIPTTGVNSKAGIIVHEASHFYAVAATNDFVYGEANCKSLARTAPAYALRNADSHEFFAENTPTLS